MTAEELQEATGCSAERVMLWDAPLTAAMERYEINTPARQAAFLAQLVHESGKFIYVRELWGPTPAQSRYEGRTDFGNIQPGDGFRYRGRGLIQITGRLNYTKAAAMLGIDCVDHPELLEQPENAANSAGDFWQSHGLNVLADMGAFETITRRINGGMNGYTDRVIAWDRAKHALGVA